MTAEAWPAGEVGPGGAEVQSLRRFPQPSQPSRWFHPLGPGHARVAGSGLSHEAPPVLKKHVHCTESLALGPGQGETNPGRRGIMNQAAGLREAATIWIRLILRPLARGHRQSPPADLQQRHTRSRYRSRHPADSGRRKAGASRRFGERRAPQIRSQSLRSGVQ